MHITLLVPGFGFPSPVVGPYEVFSSAGEFWSTLHGVAGKRLFDLTTASDDGKPVSFAGGFTAHPDKALPQIGDTDLIFVPSIGLDIEQALAANPQMLPFLQYHHARGATIAGVCTGVAVLAEAGLLEGRRATTHWALSHEYARRYRDVAWDTDQVVTEHDNVLCGGGVYAALDLSLYIVERFAGYDVARETAQALLIDPPRRRLAGMCSLNRQHSDANVRAAQDFLQAHYRDPPTMEDLARRVGMSPRNFARRFRTATGHAPISYLHELRINRARQLLETDRRSIQEICFEVGYRDLPFFRRIFKRHTGLTPTNYRSRFSPRRVSNDTG